MVIRIVNGCFSICKIKDLAGFDPAADGPEAVPYFLARTETELSLVCRTDRVPAVTAARQDGWCLLQIEGTMDLSLVGILAGLTEALADAGVAVFAVSTFDTDYLLVRSDTLGTASAALSAAGHRILGDSAD